MLYIIVSLVSIIVGLNLGFIASFNLFRKVVGKRRLIAAIDAYLQRSVTQSVTRNEDVVVKNRIGY